MYTIKLIPRFIYIWMITVLFVSCTPTANDDEPDDTDTVAPTVVSISPANGATNVAVDAVITITFSEAINTASLTNNGIRVVAAGTTTVLQGSFSTTGNAVSFIPSEDLNFETTYTVTLSSEVEDLAGNNVTNSPTVMFTTVPVPDTEGPTVMSISPSDGLTGFAADSNIVVQFSEAIASSSVTATTFTVTLAGQTQALQGTATVVDSILTFNPATTFQSNSTYNIQLTTGITDVSGNALQSQFQSSFVTEILDTAAPSVVSISVANGATDFGVGGALTVTFSEPMDVSTFSGNVTLRQNARNELASLTFQANGNDVIITPSADLRGSSQYNFNITTQVKDLAGNRLSFARARVFFTENRIFTPTSTFPDNNAENVEIDDITLRMTFAVDIDPATVTSDNFKLVVSGTSTPIAGTATVNGKDITFVPTNPLKELETEYILLVNDPIPTGNNKLADLDGNSASATSRVTFTTIQFSELYYYRIAWAPNDNVIQALNPSKEIELKPADNNLTSQQWRFTSTGNGNFALSNRFFGPSEFLEAGGANDGGSPLVGPRPNSNTFFGGQIWTISLFEGGQQFGFNTYRLRSPNLGDGFSLARENANDQMDMNPTSTSTTQNFYFLRQARID